MIETPSTPSTPHRSPDGLWDWNGTQWIPAQPAPRPQQVAQSAPPAQTVAPGKKGHLLRNVGIVIGALLLVGIGGAIASSGGSNNSPTGATTASPPAVAAAATAKATAAATAKAAPTAPAGPTLTNQQQN